MNKQDAPGSAEDAQPNRHDITAYKIPAVGFICSLAFSLVLVTQFHPATGGPIAILLFLLSIFLCFLSGVSGTLQFILLLLKKPPLTKVRLLYTSVTIAAGVVFLVGLQTLRQLQMIDVFLVVLFEFILNFYLLRRF